MILDDVAVDSHLTTLRIDDEGEEKSVSSITSFGIGLVMTLTLYMFLLMYGQLVMSSIIEEKSNRVLELMVSSVKPLQLMLGKILGIGLVAVVQVVIWGILVCCVSAFVLPLLIPEGLADQMALMNAGTFNASTSAFDPDMVKALSLFSSVGYIAKLFIYILFFLVGGFLFYASIFAAIGSAVDNAQRRLAAPDLRHAPHYPGAHGGPFRRQGSQYSYRSLDVVHPLHIAYGDAREGAFRHSLVADLGIHCGVVRLFRGNGMDRRQDLQGRHLHVWQEAHDQGPHTLGTLQMIRHYSASGRPPSCGGRPIAYHNICVSA